MSRRPRATDRVIAGSSASRWIALKAATCAG
jgi:hypothetical protein